MKFDEFKNKEKTIKKQEKKLKKQKMKNKLDLLNKKKQEIQTNMNKFVNGPSAFDGAL